MTPADIKEGIIAAGESIKGLMQISCAGACELKNQHNELFLSLIERIRYLQKRDQERQKLEEMKSSSQELVTGKHVSSRHDSSGLE